MGAVVEELFATQAKADPGPKVGFQRWISQYFVVMIVERIVQVRINSDVTGDVAPSAEVHPGVTRSVINRRDEAEQEVRVWPSPNCDGANGRAEAGTGVGQQQCSGMLRPAEQRRANSEDERIAKWLAAGRSVLNLCGRVGIGASE